MKNLLPHLVPVLILWGWLLVIYLEKLPSEWDMRHKSERCRVAALILSIVTVVVTLLAWR